MMMKVQIITILFYLINILKKSIKNWNDKDIELLNEVRTFLHLVSKILLDVEFIETMCHSNEISSKLQMLKVSL